MGARASAALAGAAMLAALALIGLSGHGLVCTAWRGEDSLRMNQEGKVEDTYEPRRVIEPPAGLVPGLPSRCRPVETGYLCVPQAGYWFWYAGDKIIVTSLPSRFIV